jgi:hypothetical protein
MQRLAAWRAVASAAGETPQLELVALLAPLPDSPRYRRTFA